MHFLGGFLYKNTPNDHNTSQFPPPQISNLGDGIWGQNEWVGEFEKKKKKKKDCPHRQNLACFRYCKHPKCCQHSCKTVLFLSNFQGWTGWWGGVMLWSKVWISVRCRGLINKNTFQKNKQKQKNFCTSLPKYDFVLDLWSLST